MKQVSIQPEKTVAQIIAGFFLQHGAIYRWHGHLTPFGDEPMNLIKNKAAYFMLPKETFDKIFEIDGKDKALEVTDKMIKTLNTYFKNLGVDERNKMLHINSQRKIPDMLIPHIGKVRVTLLYAYLYRLICFIYDIVFYMTGFIHSYHYQQCL